MGYASYTVSSTDEVVQAMVDFAGSLAGWTANIDGTGKIGTFTAPGKTRSFTATSITTNWTSSPNSPTIYLDITGAAPTGYERSLTFFRTITNSNTLGEIGGSPSKVELFGRAGPVPFIVAAVECLPGTYRHMYMGYVEALAPFNGGEIISGSPDAFYPASVDAYDYRGPSMPALFEYPTTESNYPTPSGGGVNINGQFAKFRRNGLFVEGGPRRRTMLSPFRAVNAFSGYSPLNPINIYYGTESPTDNYYIPLGTPAGVRALSMRNFFPGQIVTLPDESTWRVYPLRRKGASTTGSGNPETSGEYGFAFSMDN